MKNIRQIALGAIATVGILAGGCSVGGLYFTPQGGSGSESYKTYEPRTNIFSQKDMTSTYCTTPKEETPKEKSNPLEDESKKE